MNSLEHRKRVASFLLLSFCVTGQLTAQDEPVQQVRAVAAQPKAEPTNPLAMLVDEAISVTERRYLTADVHTPWQILHGILALRHDFLVKQGDGAIPALEWLSGGGTFHGIPIFEATRYGGRAHPFTQPKAFEGHPNQFLAILTLSNLPLDHQLKTGNGKLTVSDIVNNAKMEINDKEEITWTLWALSHYLKPSARWVNKRREPWSIERLVSMQTREPVSAGACGGSHGLFALSYARNRYMHTRRPLRGVWLEADQKIQHYIASARSLQNADGSFSTKFYQGRARSSDFNERIATSGHILEWLMIALPNSRLQEYWVRRGVAAVATDMVNHRGKSADCGPLYHALDALILYRDRTRPRQPQITQKPQKKQLVEKPSLQQKATTKKVLDGTVQTTSDSQTTGE